MEPGSPISDVSLQFDVQIAWHCLQEFVPGSNLAEYVSSFTVHIVSMLSESSTILNVNLKSLNPLTILYNCR